MSVHLQLEKVRSGYGPMEILKGIDLEVRPREIVTLIGANGAGKTTTLNTICGLVGLRDGRILFDGESIGGLPTAEIVRRGVVQVPEGRKLFSDMTVRENLDMGSYLRRDRDGIRRDLDHVLDLFPILAERRGQAAGSLSGGEQQMLAIGRGLMAKPKLLLLDEPSLGLAPLLVERIFEVIRTIREEGGTILLVEQNARLALEAADRGYVMETGRITLAADAPSLRANKAVRAAYLGA